MSGTTFSVGNVEIQLCVLRYSCPRSSKRLGRLLVSSTDWKIQGIAPQSGYPPDFHPPTPEARALMADITQTLQQALAGSTWAQYSRTWTAYQHFCVDILLTTPTLPAPTAYVLLFLASLRKKALAASTIRSAGSALSYLHMIKGLTDPMEAFIIKKFIQGLLNGTRSTDVRLPITRGILHRMVDSIPMMGFNKYKTVLLQAFYLTLFHGFLRIGEATAGSGGSVPFQSSEVSFTASSVSITLRHFKHSKSPHTIAIHATPTDRDLCPVQALLQYQALRGTCQGPFFIMPGAIPYSTPGAQSDLQSVLIFCGLDNGRYKSHSFRIGAASNAALRGFSDAQIRLMGRWHSDAFRKYIRLPY